MRPLCRFAGPATAALAGLLAAGPLAPGVASAGAAESATRPAESRPVWDLAALSRSPRVYPAPAFATNELRPLFYEGPTYSGQPTRVFAWLGLPKEAATNKVPGMVLVHGGGGTAFVDWVRLWNQRGYAAIAMDTCGCTAGGEHAQRPRHEFGGPPGWGGFDQLAAPASDQWTYHAVAAGILANSLLRAQPEVDANRIGLTGISWGGYLTCIIAGVDDRFAFAVPVYGCGYYPHTVFNGELEKLSKDLAQRWFDWWDPSHYLPRARMPMLWVNGSNDFAYYPDAWQESYRCAPGPRQLCLRVRMPHGHGGPGESPREIQVFADSLVRHGRPLLRVDGQGRQGREVWAKASPAPVRAELNFTRDRGPWPRRQWEAVPATVTDRRIAATLPADATVYYLNFFDDRDCVVSTEHEELK